MKISRLPLQKPPTQPARRLLSHPLLSALAIAALCSLTTACSTPSAPSLSSPASLSLDELIARHAATAQTREFPVARIRVEGDLNHDNLTDTLIIYRLEGDPARDGFEQYLTGKVSSTSGKPAQIIQPVLVGSHGKASVSGARILPGMIELNTLEYLPQDKSCCPTGGGVQTWIWHKDGHIQKYSPPQSSPHQEVSP